MPLDDSSIDYTFFGTKMQVAQKLVLSHKRGLILLSTFIVSYVYFCNF